MATIFTRVITGDLPGRIVWRDERCVAMVDIRPLAPGHTLVVPIAEVDHWIDLDADLAAHLTVVARHIGAAQMTAFRPARIGLVIAGFEVPHAHLHVVPATSMADLDFAHADDQASPDALDDATERLSSALRSAGHPEAV